MTRASDGARRDEIPPCRRRLSNNRLEGEDFVVVEWRAAPDTSAERPIAGLHVHHDDDEAWVVLEGTLGFRVGDELVTAGPGAAVLVPKGTPHAYWNAGDTEARYVLMMSPRTAALVEALHSGSGESYAEIFRRYASELL
jgi:mannose-6-phosphate isomerase-like protein (cupin superfamily)